MSDKNIPSKPGEKKQQPVFHVTQPKTIHDLIVDNDLSFPFIVKKISSSNVPLDGLYMPAGTILTVEKQISNIKWANSDSHGRMYMCYVEDQSFQVFDTPAWMLFEKSEKNVLSIDSYKRSKKLKKIRIK